jgi:hypothetical protein
MFYTDSERSRKSFLSEIQVSSSGTLESNWSSRCCQLVVQLSGAKEAFIAR